MARARYEYCEIFDIRSCMEQELEKLPVSNNKNETAAQFWARVEQAGLLIEALARYDELAAEFAQGRHTRRESKKDFKQRMEREGRQAEAEGVRAELLASGMTQRQAQAKLVARLQPLAGGSTAAWQTPDPWANGRLFKKKADQHLVLKLVKDADDTDGENEDEEVTEARGRLFWAELRQEERQALANARQRAEVLKREQERLRLEQAAKPKPAAKGRQKKAAVSTKAGQDRVVI